MGHLVQEFVKQLKESEITNVFNRNRFQPATNIARYLSYIDYIIETVHRNERSRTGGFCEVDPLGLGNSPVFERPSERQDPEAQDSQGKEEAGHVPSRTLKVAQLMQAFVGDPDEAEDYLLSLLTLNDTQIQDL